MIAFFWNRCLWIGFVKCEVIWVVGRERDVGHRVSFPNKNEASHYTIFSTGTRATNHESCGPPNFGRVEKINLLS